MRFPVLFYFLYTPSQLTLNEHVYEYNYAHASSVRFQCLDFPSIYFFLSSFLPFPEPFHFYLRIKNQLIQTTSVNILIASNIDEKSEYIILNDESYNKLTIIVHFPMPRLQILYYKNWIKNKRIHFYYWVIEFLLNEKIILRKHFNKFAFDNFGGGADFKW